MFNLKNGKWHPLTERLSRRARIQLLDTLIDEMDRKEIAKACDVSVQAISNWIHKKNNHPSDGTSEALLKIALEKAPRKLEEIIQNDITRYFKELEEIGIKILQDNGKLMVRKIKSGCLIHQEDLLSHLEK